MATQPSLFDVAPVKTSRKREAKKTLGAKRIRFDGSDYDAHLDDERLSNQVIRVFRGMRDGKWRTLPEIATLTGDPTPSISAQLRHLRKPRFGSHKVFKRLRGGTRGYYEYQLVVNGGAN